MFSVSAVKTATTSHGAVLNFNAVTTSFIPAACLEKKNKLVFIFMFLTVLF